jgi:SpoVK/Ycf46/Vps4 family AAA+-type ATPase
LWSSALWEGCRAQARPRLEDLAQRVSATPEWQELVAPPNVQDTLRHIVQAMRYRRRVNETWGFAADGATGAGISALFAGPSGTGKTLAASLVSI